MTKVIIKPQWFLQTEQTLHPLPKLLLLLSAIEERGTLAAACRKIGISYRRAWGLLRDFGEIFGEPVVEFRRGHGTRLSAFGAKILWADKRISARLSPLLQNLASELEAELQSVAATDATALKIHASHCFAVEALHRLLTRDARPVKVKYCGSMEALDSLCRSTCALAGFHVPIGALQPLALEFYAKWLKPQTQTLINLATRRQGIIVARGNPKGIVTMRDLAQPGLRFVNRQLGSGTRILLGLLMKQQGMDASGIAGYDSGELTHSAVASVIASGMADAGLGIEAAAHCFNLDFAPIMSERYFLIVENRALADPMILQVLEILRSRAFKAAISNLPGYDAELAGSLMRIDEAFPELASVTKTSDPTVVRTGPQLK